VPTGAGGEEGSWLRPHVDAEHRQQPRPSLLRPCDATEAEIMFRRALVGFEKALGLDHTSMLNAVDNLGILYRG
jgi:hypothetical protein